MTGQSPLVVVGAGVIGSAIAFALAREGHPVLVLDRSAPGEGGASYGNAGHVATELVEPLPAPALLVGFWRQLKVFGGVLDVPMRRLGAFTPWALRFARAAFRRRAHTELLAPFVRPAVPALAGLLADAGRPELMRQHGHYQVWMRGDVDKYARLQSRDMARLDVPVAPAPRDVLEAIRGAARLDRIAGLHFPKCAHVVDPLEVVRAFTDAAIAAGATFRRCGVRALRAAGTEAEVVTDDVTLRTRGVIVCAGAWSAPLLTPFGFKVPLESARGYHVEAPGARALVDAPIVYSDQDIVVTPMAGRLRATSYMEFEHPDAPADPAKTTWLRAQVRLLGYDCDDGTPGWVGPRPVLPDYLPAIGRATHAPWLMYAFGHQHIGLTLSGVTARAMADVVVGRPRPDLAGFDLARFS